MSLIQGKESFNVEGLIEHGNTCIKNKQLEEALKAYSEAIEWLQRGELPEDYTAQQLLRAYNNRAQVFLSLKNNEKALEDCIKVLSFDGLNEKGIIRQIKALVGLGRKAQAFEVLLNAKRFLENSSSLTEAQNVLFSNYLNLVDLVTLGAEQTNKYIFSVKQLKGIEHKKYNDTWKIEDYFDPKSEGKCFDVPCPPNSFLVDEKVIKDEMQYVQELAKSNKGTPTPLLDYSNVYTNHSELAFDEQYPLSVQYYYKFSHGEKKPNGFANVAWLRSILKLIALGKELYILLPVANSSSFTLYKVKDVGIQSGNVRCKSINWYAIQKGDVVVRDYDTHVWSTIILESVHDASQTIELFIDFLAPQFNHFDYLKSNGMPCRFFTRETVKQEENVYHEDYKGIYKFKTQLLGKDAKLYIDRNYPIDFPLSMYSSKLYSKIDQALLYEFRQRNWVPKEKSLF